MWRGISLLTYCMPLLRWTALHWFVELDLFVLSVFKILRCTLPVVKKMCFWLSFCFLTWEGNRTAVVSRGAYGSDGQHCLKSALLTWSCSLLNVTFHMKCLKPGWLATDIPTIQQMVVKYTLQNITRIPNFSYYNEVVCNSHCKFCMFIGISFNGEHPWSTTRF